MIVKRFILGLNQTTGRLFQPITTQGFELTIEKFLEASGPESCQSWKLKSKNILQKAN
jgi:hypothetical protein